MSRIVIHQLFFNRVNYLNVLKAINITQNRYKADKFGHTFALIQEGSEIRELPLIVRNVCSNEICCNECTKTEETDINNDELVNKLNNLKNETDRKKADKEIVDVIRGFKKCSSVKSLVDLLEIVMLDEITSEVALCALKKIVELENFKLHIASNKLLSTLNIKQPNIDYTKTPILEKLLEIIMTGDNNSAVVGILELISIDRVRVLPFDIFKNKISEEILCRVTENKLNIDDLCRSIDAFSKLNEVKTADQLWIGIMDKSDQINEKNVIQVFRILHLLKKSRKTIMKLLERCLQQFWHHLCTDNLIEMLYTLRLTKCSSNIILKTTSRWINTNIHTMNENNLTSLVNELNNSNYVDIGIVRALERYIKAKHSTINSPLLMVEIMNYCSKFNVRSENIFEGCAMYIIQYGSNITPSQFRDLFWPFGQLNYKPKSAIEFWIKVENIMNKEFHNFKTQETIDILLSCVYLEKHPLNFVHGVFNTSFLHHLFENGGKNDYTKIKLKIIDQCMTLECDHYRGPVLPKDKFAKSIWCDYRIKRILKEISSTLENIFQGYKISYSTILSRLPLMSIYIIDALVHPDKFELNNRYINFKKHPGLCTVILVHLPEHYCWEKEHLTGIETTRIRHFQKIGLNVMSINYEKILELKYPAELTEYINNRYENMLTPC
ncbi:FAST kinase domain-containing protein 3, mitochondrial-like [Rhopalosiphum padi]|uniref:FAST kinase domain-containing protein 3, mitochondrial-like n=1 Tax=Rhopalosiphum padi TaxID=40932 RepID=UPI00298DD958|nr:FAST kinase domain-containing protein 3, mitochondrial-like [Rhopalosiphum padi]